MELQKEKIPCTDVVLKPTADIVTSQVRLC